MRLLCGIAKAQVRAGLAAKAAETFDEAAATDLHYAAVAAFADIADAEREAGLAAADGGTSE